MILFATLAVAVWVALTWRQLACGLWVSLTGREWVAVTNSFVFAALLVAAMLAGFWFSYHPEHRERALAAVPWLIALMLVPKMLAGFWCVRQLVMRRLMTPALVGQLLFVWFAAVAVLSGLAVALLPEATVTASLLCGIAMAVPFSRLAGAPLALSFNRHR